MSAGGEGVEADPARSVEPAGEGAGPSGAVCYRGRRRAIGRIGRTAEPAQPGSRPARVRGGALRRGRRRRRPDLRPRPPGRRRRLPARNPCAACRTRRPRRWRRPANGPTSKSSTAAASEDGFLKYLLQASRRPGDRDGAHPAARSRGGARSQGTAAGGAGGAAGGAADGQVHRLSQRQVGCALACDFCATGRLGGIRSLKTWEILAQLRIVAREADHPVRGVVFMGMGEPLLNYDNVIRAARIMSIRPGRRSGPRRSRSRPPACCPPSAGSPPRGTATG